MLRGVDLNSFFFFFLGHVPYVSGMGGVFYSLFVCG